MSRIDAFNPPASHSFDSALRHGSSAKEGARASVGNYGGQSVQVDGVDAMLSDAAEEISMHHSEKAESKHASQRKKEATLTQEVMGIEAIMEYLQETEGNEEHQQLDQLAKRVLARAHHAGNPGGGRANGRESGTASSGRRGRQDRSGSGSDSDAAEEVKKIYGDNPTRHLLALQYLLQTGERDNAPADVLEDLREALDDLEWEHGSAIRADINTIATAAKSASASGHTEVLDFQSTYRDVVLGENSLAATLQLALARFGEGDFAAGLGRLIQALGQDLAAARPSTDPARLQSLVQDLYHLSVASTVLDHCKELHANVGRRHGALTGTPVQLMQELVGISAEKWMTASRLSTLSQQFGAGDVQPQILFLTGVKTLMRDMPPKIFADADQRQTVFQAAQDALDTAIDREEG